MKRVLVFFSFLTTHFVAQFLAWAYADAAHGEGTPTRLLWMVLSAPLIPAAGSLTIEYFWAVAWLNSAVWAAALTYLAFHTIFRRKEVVIVQREPPTTPS